jgi:elongation factor Ts
VRRFIYKIATLVALSAAPAGAEEVSRNVAMRLLLCLSYRVKRRRGVDAAVIEKKSKSQRSLRQEEK